MQRRTAYFLIAVAAAAAAGFALIAPAPGPTRGEPPRVATTPVTQGGSQLPATLPERSAMGNSRGDLFAVQAGAQASAPPKPGPEAATPAPPAMPYKFVGKVTLEGSTQHILAKGDRIFAVREGETLDGVYRVEALAAEEITILYLPLGVRTLLHMSLGSDAPAAQALTAAPYAIPVVPAPIASASASPPPAAKPLVPGPITSQVPDLTRTAATGTRAAHLRRERAQQLAPIKP